MFIDEEEEDEGGEQMEEIDPLSDIYSPEDHLPPLKRILSHYTSEISEERLVWGFGKRTFELQSGTYIGAQKIMIRVKISLLGFIAGRKGINERIRLHTILV